MIITKTPFRISFFGGGTDYPEWFIENEGCVLSAAIDKYCYITCRCLPPFFDHSMRVAWSKLENVSNIDDIFHPAVREGLRFMNIDSGISITHEGDLPARTGLGSSSAFMVGLLHALYAYKGRMVDKMKLAAEAIYIEREIIKDNVGYQDQIATAVGGINRIGFSARGYKVDPMILSLETIETLEASSMLFFTGISRTASEIAGEQIKLMDEKQREMRQVLSLTSQGEALLVAGDVTGFSKLLGEAWKIKRTLSNKISNSHIDDMYAAGIKAGAWGGKLLGAGGGGFLLFLCPPEKQCTVKAALGRLLHVPIKFDFNGTQIIYYAPDDLIEGSSRGDSNE